MEISDMLCLDCFQHRSDNFTSLHSLHFSSLYFTLPLIDSQRIRSHDGTHTCGCVGKRWGYGRLLVHRYGQYFTSLHPQTKFSRALPGVVKISHGHRGPRVATGPKSRENFKFSPIFRLYGTALSGQYIAGYHLTFATT